MLWAYHMRQTRVARCQGGAVYNAILHRIPQTAGFDTNGAWCHAGAHFLFSCPD